MPFETQFNILIDPDFLFDAKNKDDFTTPEQYELEVRSALLGIGRTEVGRILLRSIRWHGRWVRISPVKLGIGQDFRSCRADSATWGEQKDLDFYRSTKPFFQAFLLQFPGFHAVVRFNPEQHATGGNCWIDHTQKSDYAPMPENVLFHELIHAFRHVSKKFDMVTETHGGLSRYHAREEFNAVLVENILQSEIKGHLRKSHSGFDFLEKELAGSFEFFKVSTKTFQLIDKFCRENPGLTKALAKVKTPFNPIAAYYRNPNKARVMSKSEMAVRRDIGNVINISGVKWQTWRSLIEASGS